MTASEPSNSEQVIQPSEEGWTISVCENCGALNPAGALYLTHWKLAEPDSPGLLAQASAEQVRCGAYVPVEVVPAQALTEAREQRDRMYSGFAEDLSFAADEAEDYRGALEAIRTAAHAESGKATDVIARIDEFAREALRRAEEAAEASLTDLQASLQRFLNVWDEFDGPPLTPQDTYNAVAESVEGLRSLLKERS